MGRECIRRDDPGAEGAQVRRRAVVDERDREAPRADRVHRQDQQRAAAPRRAARLEPAADGRVAGRQKRRRRAGVDAGNLCAHVLGTEGRDRAHLPDAGPRLSGFDFRPPRRVAAIVGAGRSRFLKTAKGANFAFAGPPLHDPKTLGVGSAIGVRKDDDALRMQINQALASLIQDGTYQRIAKKYFSFDIHD
ncbi:transporter substrate-binding domain-containing protein [Burkholderia sp. Bp9142]|uniref:transporter substrate-binding domain-containing protein n=1 Tax=Burkholderia sp. Bp9142 TaxID=2184573 RepID=UPI00390CB62C